MMNKEELIKKLNILIDKSEIYCSEPFKINGDPSDWHLEADELLLSYIDDPEITQAFAKIEKWYA